MQKFFDLMEKYFVPHAAKIGSQRHLVAIRDGFVTISPIIMAGAFATLLNNIGFEWYQNFMNSILPANWKDFGGAISAGSLAIMAVLASCTIAYHLAKGYGKDGLGAAMLSLACNMLLFAPTANGNLPMTYLGGSGLFVAITVALLATEIFVKLSSSSKFIVKMPEGVPPAVAKSFAALIPTIMIIAITAMVKYLFTNVGVTDIHEALFNIIQSPLQHVIGSVWGMIALVLIQQLLWFFGLHGSNILAPIIGAVLLPLTQANMTAALAGEAPLHIINSQFLDSFVNMGGSGTTIALILAIYIGGRKSKTQMMIAKLGTAPGMFNINEPVIFGMPLVLNPMYFIPFVMAPLVSGLIAYFATVAGIMPIVTIQASWTTPPVLGAILSTNSIMGGVVAVFCIIVSIFIYLPFVKMAAKQEV
ncbi:PTS sugar transporter subunit IIC [uncultured Clostridium sp.]|uniref:PTS sugar transporter subunit IIC n=1 Tax=uncultured Clostridium sp. TaxID=59620 RepID=UPI00260BF01E|nr:PTS sugar transporter subunit IIC [uncultured Clostridium sp.]